MLSQQIQDLMQEKKDMGESAFKEWEYRKTLALQEIKRLEQKKEQKWKDMAKRSYEKKKISVRIKKQNILKYKRTQAWRKIHGPPGKNTD